MERILIGPPGEEYDSGALDHHILESTLILEQKLARGPASRTCLRKPDGSCFVLSPLAFWHHSASRLHSDDNIMDTLSLSNNVSISGIPVPLHTVLAGMSEDYKTDEGIDYARFLALTFFFPDSDCLGSGEHIEWRGFVEDAVGQDAVVIADKQGHSLIALEV